MVFTHVALGPGMGSEWQNKTIHFMDRKGRKKRKRRGPLRLNPSDWNISLDSIS